MIDLDRYLTTPSASKPNVTNLVMEYRTDKGTVYRGILIGETASHYILDIGTGEHKVIPRNCCSVVQILYG